MSAVSHAFEDKGFPVDKSHLLQSDGYHGHRQFGTYLRDSSQVIFRITGTAARKATTAHKDEDWQIRQRDEGWDIDV